MNNVIHYPGKEKISIKLSQKKNVEFFNMNNQTLDVIIDKLFFKQLQGISQEKDTQIVGHAMYSFVHTAVYFELNKSKKS